MMLHFKLVTPERVVFETDVDEVTLPTTSGEITILPHHIPLVATLVPGVARLKKGKVEEDVAVSGGFIEINENSQVHVLADTAERGFELKFDAIEAAKERAENVMREAVRSDETAYASAMAGLERELARYRVAHKHRTSTHVPMIDRSDVPKDENPE